MACVHRSLCCDIKLACRSSTRAHPCFSLSDDLSIKNTLPAAAGDGCIKGTFIFELFTSGGSKYRSQGLTYFLLRDLPLVLIFKQGVGRTYAN